MPAALPTGVSLLPSGRYRWRAMVNGHKRSGTTNTAREAEAARHAALAESTSPTGEDPTVQLLLDMRDSRDTTSSTNTRKTRKVAIGRIPTDFLQQAARKVTPRAVDALWRRMEREGVKPHTIVKAAGALSVAWSKAARLDMVPGTNPFEVSPPPAPPTTDEVSIPSVEQVTELLAWFANKQPYGAALRLMATTGARPGEACGLRWSDFDDDREHARISRSINNSGEITEGKTGRGGHRTVAIDPQTLKALKAARVVGCDWCFSLDGKRPLLPYLIRQEMKRARSPRDEKKPSRHSVEKPYALRHFAASQALKNRATREEVAAMLGNSPAMVDRTYAHVMPGTASPSIGVARALDGLG